jgi:hypothetical protein
MTAGCTRSGFAARRSAKADCNHGRACGSESLAAAKWRDAPRGPGGSRTRRDSDSALSGMAAFQLAAGSLVPVSVGRTAEHWQPAVA